MLVWGYPESIYEAFELVYGEIPEYNVSNIWAIIIYL